MARLFDFLLPVFATALVLLMVSSAVMAEQSPEAFFHKRVEPILVGRCLECHGAARKGELDLRTRETALAGGESGVVIAPGARRESLLYEHVVSEEMPPKKPLAADQVETLRRWIAEGIYYPDQPLHPFAVSTERRAGYDWWSLQPLMDVKPGNHASRAHPIDAFVKDKLAANDLLLSPAADPRTLIRRATYDLIGLPPSPDEVDAFVKACAAETGTAGTVGEKTYEALIDRLLASPHYGEQWGRHWLDVVRFGESNGFERNVLIRNVWPFRDYVIRSLNEDKPFNQLVIEHLAGDMIGSGNAEVEVGTAFLVCGPYDNVGNQDAAQAAQIRANTIDEMIRATGEAFLGLTVGCSRCHDHKFDPISQQDYYGLYATLAGVYHGSRPVASRETKTANDAAQKVLEETKTKLFEEKDAIEKAVVARAEAKATEYEARWTRFSANRRGNIEVFPSVDARYVRLRVEGKDGNPRVSTGFGLEEFEAWTAEAEPRNVAAAANGGTAEGKSRRAEDFNEAYSASLTIDGMHGARWIAYGSTLTITFAKPETINRVSFATDRSGSAGAHSVATAPCEYRVEVSSDGKTWQAVANSYDRKPVNKSHRRIRFIRAESNDDETKRIATIYKEIADVEKQLKRKPEFSSWWLGTFKQHNEPFHVFIGGSPERKGEAVVPAGPESLKRAIAGYKLKSNAHEGGRRLQLARWFVDNDNPLTPRVLANRLWHYHFGTGIVDTPSDFGFMGGRPTHPELLDWLARQVHESDWRLKPLHKSIMMSRTYRQSSAYRASAAQKDADSRLLWRFPPRRLASDEIRDSMLAIAGKLDTKMGGPGFRLFRYLEDNVATYVPLDKHGPETYRRSVYHHNARAMRIDLMSDFDSPDCAFSTPRRSSTTTPLQALTLLNHSFTMDMAAHLAERLKQDAGGADPNPQVRRAFQLAFARSPSGEETTLGTQLIEQHGLPAFCRAIFNANELIYLD